MVHYITLLFYISYRGNISKGEGGLDFVISVDNMVLPGEINLNVIAAFWYNRPDNINIFAWVLQQSMEHWYFLTYCGILSDRPVTIRKIWESGGGEMGLSSEAIQWELSFKRLDVNKDSTC